MSRQHVLSFREAHANIKARGAPHAWRDVVDDFGGEVWPEFHPSFRIRPGEVIFTMGSCFARNIETHLAMLGCVVPMMDFDLPPTEWGGGVHGAMNRFHPPAFRQTLQWVGGIYDRDGQVVWDDCAVYAFPCGDELYLDLDMGSAAPVTHARFVERRQHVYDIFSQAFSAACLMMTPGLIEAWRDRETGFYLHNAPKHRAMLRNPDRWEFEVLPYDACRDAMLAAIDCVRARNPGVKVLLTTSPVPLSATFTTDDIRIANMHSKSVLRAVCGEARLSRPDVDYFPSYESVMLSFPKGLWKTDRLHVSQGFIAKIVSRMLDQYLDGVDAADRECQRARMHLLSGQVADGEACARAALELRPGDVDARRFLAEALSRQERGDEAKAELKALIQDNPGQPEPWLALARAQARDSEPRETLASIEAALTLPGVALLDVLSALKGVAPCDDQPTLERIGRRVVELFPLHAESYQPLVDALVEARRLDEAREVLELAVTRRRSTAHMHVLLAKLLGKQGRLDKARDQLQLALNKEPDSAKAKDLMQRFSGRQLELAAAAAT